VPLLELWLWLPATLPHRRRSPTNFRTPPQLARGAPEGPAQRWPQWPLLRVSPPPLSKPPAPAPATQPPLLVRHLPSSPSATYHLPPSPAIYHLPPALTTASDQGCSGATEFSALFNQLSAKATEPSPAPTPSLRYRHRSNAAVSATAPFSPVGPAVAKAPPPTPPSPFVPHLPPVTCYLLRLPRSVPGVRGSLSSQRCSTSYLLKPLNSTLPRPPSGFRHRYRSSSATSTPHVSHECRPYHAHWGSSAAGLPAADPRQ